MSPYKKNQKEKRRKNLFRKWHRRMGFTVALFLFNLAITGILLNHSDDLNLHKKYIKSDWLVSWYGIKAPDSGYCIIIDNLQDKICQLGDKIYLGDTLLIDQSTSIIGLIEMEDLLYLATSSTLYIYTKSFELVETMTQESGLPVPIRKIGLFNDNNEKRESDKLLISDGLSTWSLAQDNFNWKKTEIETLVSTELLILEDRYLVNLQKNYLDDQITQLKFIQDLHSGRIFSLPGKLLTDLVGIIIILLAISGFFAWQRRKEKVS